MKPPVQDSHLTLRDKLLRDNFTLAETLLCCILILCSLAVLYPGQPRSNWLICFFFIIGALTPVLLKTHEFTHPFFIDKLWSRFGLLIAPFLLLQFTYIIGLFQAPLVSVLLEETTYRQLVPINIFQPTSTEPNSTWIALLGFGCIYAISLTVLIIPKSIAYFERVLPWFCLIASLIAVFGYMQKIGGHDAPFYAREHPSDDYFSIFAYDGHWAAYALLWMTACFGFTFLTLAYAKNIPFSKTMAPWYLSGALLLGYSGFFVQSRFSSSLLLLYFSIFATLFTLSYLKRPIARALKIKVGIASTLLIALPAGVALQRLMQPHPFDSTAVGLRQAAYRMFLDNPLFGWGMDAFTHLSQFYQSDLLLSQSHERAFSDILQMLAEFGLVGSIPIILLFLWQLLRYFRGPNAQVLPNLLLAACFGIVLLSFVDSPFMSPAVFMSFLILFFSALRWTELSRASVDVVDTDTVVVTNSNLRKVPFYTGPKKEAFK